MAALVARILSWIRGDVQTSYPSLWEAWDAFPDESVFKLRMKRHMESFLDVYRRSFRRPFDAPREIRAANAAMRRTEAHAKEMLFRIPNDLRLQRDLEDRLRYILETFAYMKRDMEERWMDAT
jgi:hypothetical protein